MLQQIARPHTDPSLLVRAEPSVAEQFDAHRIEPELLGVRPRWLKRSLAGRDIHLGVLLPFIAITVWSFDSWNALSFLNWLGSFVGLLGIGFGVDNWFSETRQAGRRKELLRRGLAVPAMVSDLRRADFGVSVEYVYRTPNGDIFFDTITVPAKDVLPRDFPIGTTFTALVFPENPRTVMPYFLAGEYAVRPLEASAISQKITRNIQVQAQSHPLPVSGRLGSIEPELLGAAPRNIRHARRALRMMIWGGAILAAAGTLVMLSFTLGYQILYVLALLVCLEELLRYLGFYGYYRTGRLLQRGIPARAIIINVSPLAHLIHDGNSPNVRFTYHFETREGILQTGYLTRSRDAAARENLYEGTTFTVLYNAKNPGEFAPYFDIREGEIVGALGAKVSPPPQQPPLSRTGFLP